MKVKIREVLLTAFKKFLLLRLPYFTKNVLIVRLDFVGDYILFRNGIDVIRNSERFKNYKFTLLGNIAYKDIAECYDGEKFDHFIWINPKALSDYSKMLLLLIKLKLKAYHTVINPTLSVTIKTDLFLKYLNAKETIGSSKRNELNPHYYFFLEQPTSESCYTELIYVPDNSNFEWFRNIKFIENLTRSTNIKLKFELPVVRKKQTSELQTSKLIIVPGASKEYRRWSTVNFAYLIQKLHNFYGDDYVFYLTGSKGEVSLGEQICNNITNKKIKIKNLIGKTTLIETVELVNDSKCIISNETGTVHIAAALKIPAVCISNGNDFGRFNPYPSSLADNIITLYPNDDFKRDELYHQNVKTYVGSSLNIDDINVASVFEATKALLFKINQ